MRAAPTLLAIGMALSMASGAAQALGFGRVVNATQLGQVLNFAATLTIDPDEALPRECVFAEVSSGDNKLLPAQIRVTLEGSGATRNVRVTSSALIDEPVVTVSVTLGCTAQVTRKFVAFVDPPALNLAQADALPELPAQRLVSQIEPLMAAVRGPRDSSVGGAASATRGARNVRRRKDEFVGAAAAAPVALAASGAAGARVAKAGRTQHAAEPVSAGPRLQLEAAPLVATSAAVPASTPAPSALADALAATEAASSAAFASEQALAAERQRFNALEEAIGKLRTQTSANEQTLAAMQLRIRSAESERYANPLVYALAALSALLAGLVAAMWWRQSQRRLGAQWWAPPSVAAVPVVVAATSAAPVPEPAAGAADATPANVPVVTAAQVLRVYEEESNAALDTATRPAPFHSMPMVVAAPEAPRELSVEELIDLEQQAEFFVVLGQDDAAIELLMSHVRSDGGISPLPYLKLLEIYRRRGETEAYERIRDRFNRRFNAYAPDWDADLQHGLTLADYPEMVTSLQSIWSDPAKVMRMLDAALFRRDRTDLTFDLPAYRELLLLYSVSRDLSEQDGSVSPPLHLGASDLPAARRASDGVGTGVDLLLPFEEEGPFDPISHLHATMPMEAVNSGDVFTRPLDLDVTFGPESVTADVDTSSGAWPRAGGEAPLDSNYIDFDLGPPTPVRSPSRR